MLYQANIQCLLLDSVVSFNLMKELYSEDLEFSSRGVYTIQERFFFRNNKLCMSKSSLRELLIWEIHGGGLAGHFDINNCWSPARTFFIGPKRMGICILSFRCVQLVKQGITSIKRFILHFCFHRDPRRMYECHCGSSKTRKGKWWKYSCGCSIF